MEILSKINTKSRVLRVKIPTKKVKFGISNFALRFLARFGILGLKTKFPTTKKMRFGILETKIAILTTRFEILNFALRFLVRFGILGLKTKFPTTKKMRFGILKSKIAILTTRFEISNFALRFFARSKILGLKTKIPTIKKSRFGILVLALFLAETSAQNFTFERDLELKKDEKYTAKIEVGGVKKDLSFRWTLFKDGVLIAHLKYDKFPHQPSFALDYKVNSFALDLGAWESADHPPPRIHIFFKDFAWDAVDGNISRGDPAKNAARFGVYISGEAGISEQNK